MSVEANPFHARDLRFAARFVGRHSHLLAGASDHEGEMVLYVPMFRGVPRAHRKIDPLEERDAGTKSAPQARRRDAKYRSSTR